MTSRILLSAALVVSLVSLCPDLAAADDPSAEPSLAVRTDRGTPWLRYAVAFDLLGIAWNDYRLSATIGVERHLGVRVEGEWRRGLDRGPGGGLGVELWPLGRGVDGPTVYVGSDVAIDLDRERKVVGALIELGYTFVWRGVALSGAIGARSQWTLGLQRDHGYAPTGRVTVGWAF